MDARSSYESGRAARAREIASLEARSRRISTARLALAAAALVLVGGVVWAHLGAWAWITLAVIAMAFVALVFIHARADDAKQRAAAALRFHERGLARLSHAWERLPTTSERFRSSAHPFTADLDVFGHASLMQLVDATETRFGEERLAHLLSSESPGSWPEDVLLRQRAVRDLASRFTFREGLAMSGGVLADEKPDPSSLLAWAEEPKRSEGRHDADPGGAAPGPGASPRVPQPSALLLTYAAWLVPLAAAAGLVAVLALQARAGAAVVVVIAELLVGTAAGRRVSPILDAVSAGQSAVTRWRAMIASVEREPFEAPLLVRLREHLGQGSSTASKELARLERIVGFADARRNEAFRLLLGPLLMWDAHCALALLKWRKQAGAHVRGWLDTLGEVEALAGLAAFAFEHPDFAWPSFAAQAAFEAQGLGHPLIADDRRVGNDVRLPGPGRALVVTGSNMSGKSTLLKAMGVNAVLALAGAPVCARSLRLGPARVATSMKVEDSLEQGVSHFYAELRRIKRVLDLAREPEGGAVLFLLDEILHGTNSRERVIGARAVVQDLLARGSLGAVSTHDLGITALDRELDGKAENVHFEEQVEGDTMTFDYVLRPGVVQSSNALRLMRAMGILG